MAGVALVAVLVGVSLLGGSRDTASDPVGVPATAGEAPATRQAMIGEEARDGQLVFVVEDLACNVNRRRQPADGQALNASVQR